MIIGFTNGCFDLFHEGHQHLLRECQKHCDKLYVAVNSDVSVTRLKGKGRPINDERLRKAAVQANLRADDLAFIFWSEDQLRQLIKSLKTDILFKGGEYLYRPITGHDLAKLMLIPMLPGISTTKLIEERG